jgi:ATP-dependent DNA ligase
VDGYIGPPFAGLKKANFAEAYSESLGDQRVTGLVEGSLAWTRNFSSLGNISPTNTLPVTMGIATAPVNRIRHGSVEDACRPAFASGLHWTLLPTCPKWIHELKYDSYRIIAYKDGEVVRLWNAQRPELGHELYEDRGWCSMARPCACVCGARSYCRRGTR